MHYLYHMVHLKYFSQYLHIRSKSSLTSHSFLLVCLKNLRVFVYMFCVFWIKDELLASLVLFCTELSMCGLREPFRLPKCKAAAIALCF